MAKYEEKMTYLRNKNKEVWSSKLEMSDELGEVLSCLAQRNKYVRCFEAAMNLAGMTMVPLVSDQLLWINGQSRVVPGLWDQPEVVARKPASTSLARMAIHT